MKLTIGAYTLYPGADQGELGTPGDVLAGLGEIPAVGGFEIPFRGAQAGPYWDGYWPAGAPSGSHLVITAIPYTMAQQATRPGYGLASSDEDCRRDTLQMYRVINKTVSRIVADHGQQVAAIQVHSAPHGGGSSRQFARSLAELVSWDWHGAALCVEHCDARTGRKVPEKAFLTLDEELQAIASVYSDFGDLVATGAETTRLGMSINWARSVLETGDPHTALEHLETVQEHGLLRGYMTSGIAGTDTDFGPAWQDAHLPPAGIGGAPDNAVMSVDDMLEAWDKAGSDLIFKGLKMQLRPTSLTLPERVETLRSIIELLPLGGE